MNNFMLFQVRERLRSANEKNSILDEELVLANQEVGVAYINTSHDDVES